ncbi:IMPACT family protein [Candidatus Contubernalis alkaliaceticus]|uniref:IMPACT family protein n=1 Tax=Candidatus Contubernalis alkaliaceticus TaxID=338645 RepID=UPI001F4C0C41|nr:YigZ family protein [Candidatus Contubernalis alkalaceticus]UNC92596.1 YigZ family protein [Candidatus Contubernalis alkalaceticus]
MDYYLTIKKEARIKIAVGACRFIASVGFCGSEKQARDFIQRVKEEFSNATHNAFAYRIGTGEDTIVRTSDADEPVGTAGPPILSSIDKVGLTNVVVVGTRYFGGVKLGIGGLIRAYRACSEAGLKEAGVEKKVITRNYTIIIPYDYIGQVINEISGFQGEVTAVRYDTLVEIDNVMPPKNYESFTNKLNDITRGQAKIRLKG